MSPQEVISSPSKYASAELIPFDPNSEAHSTRLLRQRQACTWDFDLIDEWKAKVLEGKKYMYWIIINDNVPEKDEHLAKHFERFPNEKEPIVDTAEILGNSTRTPTQASFIPIGHVALDLYPDRNEQLSLPESTVWVKSLYISWAIQFGGFGRSAMYQVERLAALPPLNATVMGLDTPRKEFQSLPRNIELFNKIRGANITAADFRSNEEWYVRQGYSIIDYFDSLYTWTEPETGALVKVPLVFLKKNIV